MEEERDADERRGKKRVGGSEVLGSAREGGPGVNFFFFACPKLFGDRYQKDPAKAKKVRTGCTWACYCLYQLDEMVDLTRDKAPLPNLHTAHCCSKVLDSFFFLFFFLPLSYLAGLVTMVLRFGPGVSSFFQTFACELRRPGFE